MFRKPTPYEVALWAALPMAHTPRLEGRLTLILDQTRSRRATTRRTLLLALTPGAAALVALAVLRLDARAQAAPPAVNPASPAPLASPPQAPETISRHLIGPQHPPMKQEGAIAWSAPRLASPPKGPLSGDKTVAEQTPKHLKAAPRKLAPIFVLPVPVLPTVTHVTGRVIGGVVADLIDASPTFNYEAASATFTSASQTTGPANAVFSPDLTLNSTTLLAGVIDADKPGGAWWSASGKVMSVPVYDTNAYRAENHAGADTHNVSFALRLPPSARGLTVQYEVPQSRGFSSDGFWPTKLQENQGRTEAEVFSRTGGVRVLTAAFPASLIEADLRVGLGFGRWQVAATYVPTATGYGSSDVAPGGNNKFLFSPVSETKDGTIQSITTDATGDLRVVAVDAQGRETLPLLIGGNSVGALDQITARFALPLAQIKEIRVETRPFWWVTFKDVALQPVK